MGERGADSRRTLVRSLDEAGTGFAPTFYLRGSFAQSRPMSVLLHVHGVVFSAWVSFFLVQTLLIERGSRRLHQRLGWVGAGIAAAMVILVTGA